MGAARRCRIGAGAAALVLAGCTAAHRESRASSYVVLDALVAAPGGSTSAAGFLQSDVRTFLEAAEGGQPVRVPAALEDTLQATFHLALVDPGAPSAPAAPSPVNAITLTRYHVEFARADGRETPGVDVPYPFDGGLTCTVSGAAVTAHVVLVRAQAKREAPLAALVNGGGAVIISTVATVTFYGADQAGRRASVSGTIGVDFSDWQDPNVAAPSVSPSRAAPVGQR